jgi:hypothetical protein
MAAELVDQTQNISWAVFAVPIHHHGGGAGQILMDVNQSDCDGALMTQVPAQVQDLYRMKVLEILRQQPWLERLGGTIIDEQDFDSRHFSSHPAVFEGVVQGWQQQGDSAPVVEYRDEDNQPSCVVLLHFQPGGEIGRIQ